MGNSLFGFCRMYKMKLKEAADKIEKGIEETLTYMEFPYVLMSIKI